eukprot:EG_transcript_20004
MSNYEDLSGVIDTCSLECLNEKPDKNIGRIFPPSGGILESDADEQLLLNIAFTTAVKLYSLELTAPSDGRRPNTVKLFANMHIMDFANAESAAPTQECVLEWKPHDGTRMKALVLTKFVKFQDVRNIALFVVDNVGGDDTSAISAIALQGSVLSGTNMKDLKKTS